MPPPLRPAPCSDEQLAHCKSSKCSFSVTSSVWSGPRHVHGAARPGQLATSIIVYLRPAPPAPVFMDIEILKHDLRRDKLSPHRLIVSRQPFCGHKLVCKCVYDCEIAALIFISLACFPFLECDYCLIVSVYISFTPISSPVMYVCLYSY